MVRFFSHGVFHHIVNPLVVDPGMGYMFVKIFPIQRKDMEKKT